MLQNLPHRPGFIVGGGTGRRAVDAAGSQTRAGTLLRRVVQAPGSQQIRTQHVGSDKRTWHRGHRYGTLIVTPDTHRPRVLLPRREQRTLTA